jgi:uncharacterized repeat protein (TIGR01451 family)
MKNLSFLFVFIVLLGWNNTQAQNCGVIYGAGYSGAGSSVGVRAYDFATNTFGPASLISTALFTAPNTINNGGPIAIDPLNQNINFITDAVSPRRAALFTFASSSINFIDFPAPLDAAVTSQVFCSGYKPLSHQCYYMTGNFLSTQPTPVGSAFFKIDFTNTAAPTYQIYTPILSPGSPLVNISGGGSSGADLCFDANDIGYMVTGSKQLFRINPDDVSGNATFTYLAQMNSLSFIPTAVAFNPISGALVITGDTYTVAEYNLATNVITNLTTTAGYSAPDLASCFFPNINASLQITKTFYDVTQALAPPAVTVITNDIVEYTITTKNVGNVNAGGFTITDAIPAGTTYEAGTTTLNGLAVTDGMGATFPFQTASAASSGDHSTANGILTTNTTTGAPVSIIKYKVKVIATSGLITNTAVAKVAGVDPNVPLSATASVSFYANGLLPIKLISFEVSKANNNAMLKWITDNSSNENYFEIEHSSNGVNFNAIAKVMSSNTSNKQYSFIDGTTRTNTNWYRLKMVDLDGNISYSDIRKINFIDKRNLIVELYPNPTKNRNVNLDIPNNYKKLSVCIKNCIGETSSIQYFENNVHHINLNLANLSSGIYFIETIVDGVKFKTEKLIIE